jgi:hypothetical protein
VTPETEQTPETEVAQETPEAEVTEETQETEEAQETEETEETQETPEAAEAQDSEPEVVEEERWAAFAPRPTRTPGWPRRSAAALGRGLGHEWTLTVFGGLALAVVMTWPVLRHARYTLPQDTGDPALVAWVLAWPGQVLFSDPGELWHGNAFYPGRWSLAFTDSLLGYAPFSLIGEGPLDALLRYNIIYVLVYALAFIGAYALVRQLGAGPPAALVAALAFAYAPWHSAHAGHLHVLSTGGMVLALAMLARGHDWSLRRRRAGSRRRVRPGWIVAGWLVAAWQITIGFGVGLVFAYVLALVVVVVAAGWVVRRIARRAREPVGRIVGANLVGGTIFTATTLLMALPYLTVVELYPNAKRAISEVEFFSPPLRGFLTAPEQSWLWGSLHEGARSLPVGDGKEFQTAEMALLPGFALIGLAVAGLLVSSWSVRARLWLAAGVVLSAGLTMGTEVFDGVIYRPLFYGLPGWDALRTPGRMVIWTTLLLGLLAAGAVGALASRSRELARSRGFRQPGGWLRLATLLPAVLVLAEGVNTVPAVVVPPQPAALATVEGPVLVLPSNSWTDVKVMLWTTDRFVPVVNGASGFVPPPLAEARQVTQTFPDPASVDYLRSLGVATVVVLPDRVGGTPWEGAVTATGAELGLTREEIGGAIVFHLGPGPGPG